MSANICRRQERSDSEPRKEEAGRYINPHLRSQPKQEEWMKEQEAKKQQRVQENEHKVTRDWGLWFRLFVTRTFQWGVLVQYFSHHALYTPYWNVYVIIKRDFVLDQSRDDSDSLQPSFTKHSVVV